MSFRFFTLPALAATCLFLTAGCGDSSTPEKDPNVLTSNDFEEVIGWVPAPPTLTREQAHSGFYSVKVDGANEFSMGYSLPLGKATMRKPHKIRISAWAYMTDDKSSARLGLQLMDPVAGKEVFGDGINLSEAVKTPRKWVEITKDIILPDATTSATEMRVFLWRSSATSPAYIDDLRIALVE